MLGDAGIPLDTNQVEYSLLKREAEVIGVLDTCHELDITLVAYMPLASGALTGKYDAQSRPTGHCGGSPSGGHCPSGAMNARQAPSNAGALHMSLEPAEMESLDQTTRPWRK